MRSRMFPAAGLGLAAFFVVVSTAPPAAAQKQPVQAQPQSAQGQQAQPAAQGQANPLLATVNGEAIYLADVKDEVQNLPEQYRNIPPERLMPLMLNQLITNRLLLAEGTKQKLADSEEVKKKVERYREKAVQQQLLTQVIGKAVNDEALQTLYKKYVAENPPKEEVSARHILVNSEAEGTAIIQQIKGGADFATLAKQKSKDPAAQNGGDLGFFGREDMVKEFADAAFAMKTGEVTPKPVKTQFGFHVIKVEDRRTANPVTFEEAKDDLQSQLSQQAVSQYIETLRTGAKIERFGPDGKPLPPE
ncbi:MAG: peptidylprolyl isomerase [Alphaproteobacteria bacterium]|nr:peptidylprolyl isomerase [Alphaproteobacteria bacterium]